MAATEEVWLPREVHNDRGATYRNDGECYYWRGVLEYYCTVLAPALFSIFLSEMLDKAFRDLGDSVYIQSRQSADQFNVAHFRTKTKTTRILMRELLFADYSALVAHSTEEIQNIVDAFSDALKLFGQKINIKKTAVL